MNSIHQDHDHDLLSGLPDDILLQILSIVPIKDAAKTALFRRFGSLWRRIPVLDLDQCSYHVCHNGPYHNKQFINLIHQVIKLNSSMTIEKLRLKMHFYKGRDENDLLLEDFAAEINSVVHYALSRKVKVLDLDFLGCGLFELVEDYTVPDSVFRSDCLVELRLAYCDIQNRGGRRGGEIRLKSLKILFLNGVELNDELMEMILLGCPLLEDLSMIGGSSLTKLNCNGNSNMKRLNLVLHMGKPLMISYPGNLVSVEIGGCVERARLV
ncbi:OLC1v1025164C1 [Oldenlandia corymbosa var. corymbosa]|uniref:OLC1v1025164C1 n=1 Tax=Oldenlandia corymbosa var. corymbosa TaxID=529605 RepID=A0AAV1C439_OLDCO|nr:OLC1v1025164C1 [Oldenlandia corymbosa var. corymbosa]